MPPRAGERGGGGAGGESDSGSVLSVGGGGGGAVGWCGYRWRTLLDAMSRLTAWCRPMNDRPVLGRHCQQSR